MFFSFLSPRRVAFLLDTVLLLLMTVYLNHDTPAMVACFFAKGGHFSTNRSYQIGALGYGRDTYGPSYDMNNYSQATFVSSRAKLHPSITVKKICPLVASRLLSSSTHPPDSFSVYDKLF